MKACIHCRFDSRWGRFCRYQVATTWKTVCR